jgi:hypothetical protein
MLYTSIADSPIRLACLPESRSEEAEPRQGSVAVSDSPTPHEPDHWQSPQVVKQIGALARRWSLGQPDLREDLFQEGWLAAWQAEVDDPACPPNHLVRVAEQRMLWVRRLGRSVDGKPHATHERAVVYQVNSLDQRTRAGDGRPCALHEVIPSRLPNLADHVLGYLHTVAFLTTLHAMDQRILGLRLAGYRWCEVTQTIRLNPRALHGRRAALRADAQRHWSPESGPH